MPKSDIKSHKFDEDLLVLFDAVEGAYSPVTEAEDNKGHITTTGPEAEIIKSFFGTENIHVGAKKLDPDNATKTFNVLGYKGNSGQASLTTNFPKPAKGELHIYMHRQEGFRPTAHDIWFIFRREGEGNLFIGSMRQEEWNMFIDTIPTEENQQGEVEDKIFQEMINLPTSPKSQKISTSLKYPRSIKVSKDSMESVQYKCEIDKSHMTFKNKATGKPYVEGHHLVPLSKQDKFKTSLDVHANVVILCPNCHRKIHHAEYSDSSEMLSILYKQRHKALEDSDIKIDLESLISLYE